MTTYTPVSTRRSTPVYVLALLGTVAAMATWIKTNHVGFTFITSLVLGLILVTAAAFTVSCGLGLLVAGISSITGGHWLTYLKEMRR